jgi:hypothetical protein
MILAIKLIKFRIKKEISADNDNNGLNCFTGNDFLLLFIFMQVWIVNNNWEAKHIIYEIWYY